MVDAFVADLATGLVRKLVSLATEEVIQAWNLHQDLVTLRERLETIDALLSDADTKNLTMFTVQNWFNKLKNIVHVADTFMDELAYEVTRQKVSNHHKVQDFFIPSKNGMLYRFKMAHTIKSLHTSFDQLFKLAENLGLQPVAHLSSTLQPREFRNNPPFEDESLIVGRDEEISYLVQMVCRDHEEDLQVIAVVGMGGQGKTTLARMVYNSDSVISMFPKRLWVTVSDNFDFMKILNQMVVSLTLTASTLENSEVLIKIIQNNLKGEKFLLVLDDVWDEKPDEWNNLRNSLLGIGGARGSNILVTTRKHDVVDAMRCSVSHRMEKLSEEHSWELFKQRAFSHGGVLQTEKFAAMGRRMVKRCGGLPLAIKTLRGLLHSKKSEQEWLLIQNSEIWKLKGVLSSLRLSYDNLPCSSLKRCFAYCSILPKDSAIYKNEVVHIWMALGFLLPPRGSNVLMEDIGNEFFDILLWNSLLQDAESDAYGNITYCKMHDLVHDLALHVSTSYSAIVMPSNISNHLSKAKHVRLEGFEDVKAITFKVYFDTVQALYAYASIFCAVLSSLKHLRVLVLNSSLVPIELPSSIGNLKCLKYLDISGALKGGDKLPNYITKLFNLQTLRVCALQELPEKFCNLINLRYIVVEKKYVHNNPRRRCIFTGIKRLTCLQTLPHFIVSKDHNCLAGQLGGLKDLRGKLELYGLSDIENMEEARTTSLCAKSNIECLELFWKNDKNVMSKIKYNDEVVIEGLGPHKNLKQLTIVYFKGKKLASWITMMTNLVKITVRDCKRCEGIPSLGHLPKLKEMELIRMDNLVVIESDSCGGLGCCRSELSDSSGAKTVTTMYPSLTKLIMWDLPNLEWLEPAMRTGCEDQHSMLVFPKLEVLEIGCCPKLKRILSSCFPSLKRLDIIDLDSSIILETMSRKVRSLRYLRLWNITDSGRGGSSFSNMDSINELLKNNSMSLTSLNLCDCQSLTCVTLGAALEKLKVVNCPNLTSINLVEESSKLNYYISGCPILKERSWKGSGKHYFKRVTWSEDTR